jgi:regulator of sigma E protease
MPIPVLDGGHILILTIEGVMRRNLSETVKERVMQAGLVFLIAFMGVIIFLDVVKIL